MSVVINADVGGLAPNSYLTLADAEAYFASRLHGARWSASSEPNKNIALVEATRLLDGAALWVGRKWDDEQSLEWPRSGVYDRNEHWISHEVIPAQVKNATAELAMWLLSKHRAAETAEPSSSGIQSLGVGSGAISITFNQQDRLELIPATIINNLLQGLGYVVGNDGGNLPVVRS